VCRKVIAIVLVALTNCALLASPATSLAGNPQVIVFVYNDARVPGDTLIRAEQQANNAFSRAGLEITWLNCIHGTPACTEIGGSNHLILRITPNVARSISDAAFGIAFLGSDETGRNADVFWKRAQEIQENSKVDVTLILGSVMAHEIGHLLLGSNAHAVSGIMRAHWEGNELRRISMGSLLFLPEQGKRMRARVEQQRELLMSRGERPVN
jgi:hypothetical protein